MACTVTHFLHKYLQQTDNTVPSERILTVALRKQTVFTELHTKLFILQQALNVFFSGAVYGTILINFSVFTIYAYGMWTSLKIPPKILSLKARTVIAENDK